MGFGRWCACVIDQTRSYYVDVISLLWLSLHGVKVVILY